MRCLEKRPADRWQIGRRAAGAARAAGHAERRHDARRDPPGRARRWGIPARGSPGVVVVSAAVWAVAMHGWGRLPREHLALNLG